MATLLKVVAEHPRGTGVLPPPPVPSSGDTAGELAAITRKAAQAQRIAEVTDWLGAAKIALQVGST